MTDLVAPYLQRLERVLRSLPSEDRTAIITEIKSHIEDRTAATGLPISDALDSLGDPIELGKAYVDQYRLEDAVIHSAHGTLLVTILERARRSLLAGLFGLFAVISYLFAAIFAAMAILKPILPQFVGVWRTGNAYSFGILTIFPQNKELLGYWIIPITLVLGIACFLAGRALIRLGGRALLRKTSRNLH
jgi:uncharacterized membrane protein